MWLLSARQHTVHASALSPGSNRRATGLCAEPTSAVLQQHCLRLVCLHAYKPQTSGSDLRCVHVCPSLSLSQHAADQKVHACVHVYDVRTWQPPAEHKKPNRRVFTGGESHGWNCCLPSTPTQMCTAPVLGRVYNKGTIWQQTQYTTAEPQRDVCAWECHPFQGSRAAASGRTSEREGVCMQPVSAALQTRQPPARPPAQQHTKA